MTNEREDSSSQFSLSELFYNMVIPSRDLPAIQSGGELRNNEFLSLSKAFALQCLRRYESSPKSSRKEQVESFREIIENAKTLSELHQHAYLAYESAKLASSKSRLADCALEGLIVFPLCLQMLERVEKLKALDELREIDIVNCMYYLINMQCPDDDYLGKSEDRRAAQRLFEASKDAILCLLFQLSHSHPGVTLVGEPYRGDYGAQKQLYQFSMAYSKQCLKTISDRISISPVGKYDFPTLIILIARQKDILTEFRYLRTNNSQNPCCLLIDDCLQIKKSFAGKDNDVFYPGQFKQSLNPLLKKISGQPWQYLFIPILRALLPKTFRQEITQVIIEALTEDQAQERKYLKKIFAVEANKDYASYLAAVALIDSGYDRQFIFMLNSDLDPSILSLCEASKGNIGSGECKFLLLKASIMIDIRQYQGRHSKAQRKCLAKIFAAIDPNELGAALSEFGKKSERCAVVVKNAQAGLEFFAAEISEAEEKHSDLVDEINQKIERKKIELQRTQETDPDKPSNLLRVKLLDILKSGYLGKFENFNSRTLAFHVTEAAGTSLGLSLVVSRIFSMLLPHQSRLDQTERCVDTIGDTSMSADKLLQELVRIKNEVLFTHKSKLGSKSGLAECIDSMISALESEDRLKFRRRDQERSARQALVAESSGVSSARVSSVSSPAGSRSSPNFFDSTPAGGNAETYVDPTKGVVLKVTKLNSGTSSNQSSGGPSTAIVTSAFSAHTGVWTWPTKDAETDLKASDDYCLKGSSLGSGF
ncbi:MAG: hypothetical protein V3V61_02830 [Gammaproteobacteria bacterium]